MVPAVSLVPFATVCSLRITKISEPSGCGIAMVVFGVIVPPLMPTMLVPLMDRLTKHGDVAEQLLGQASAPHVLPNVVLATVLVAELVDFTSIRSAVMRPSNRLVLWTTEADVALGLPLVLPDVEFPAVSVVTSGGAVTNATLSEFDPPVDGS